MEENKKYIKRFYQELLVKDNRKTIVYIIILSLAQILISLFSPFLMMSVLDNAIPKGNIRMVLILGGGVLISSLFEAILNYCLQYIYSKFSNTVYVNFQKRCITHLLQMSGEYYSNTASGEIFTTIFQDIDKIKNLVSETIFQFLLDIIIAVSMFFLLLYLQWDLLLSIVFIMPILFLVQRYFEKIGNKKAVNIRESYGAVTGLLENLITGIVPLIYSKGEKVLQRKYEKSIGNLVKNGIDIDLVFAKNNGILKFLSALINIDILAFGGIKVITSRLSIGGFMAFNMYSSKLITPILEVSGFLMKMQTIRVSLKKVYDFLDMPTNMDYNGKRTGIEEQGNTIIFEDVVFGYQEGLILDKLSMHIKPNTINVIIGESGVGKSSLISLLYRLWDIQNGNIFINNIELREYEVTYIRDNLSILSQEMYLFNDTIYNNIALEIQCDKSEVEKVAKVAYIHKFITSLPDGYNTIVGERGMKLSGGEKQRICLARILLRREPILILDEPTSALDQITEKKVMENIQKRIVGKTIIIVTHRIHSIKKADCIHVFRDGRIEAQGKHEELMQSNEYYRKMYMREEVNE